MSTLAFKEWSLLELGDRVGYNRDTLAYPNILVPKGTEGTVLACTPHGVQIRPDDFVVRARLRTGGIAIHVRFDDLTDDGGEELSPLDILSSDSKPEM